MYIVHITQENNRCKRSRNLENVLAHDDIAEDHYSRLHEKARSLPK